jgi:hypothetical protein
LLNPEKSLVGSIYSNTLMEESEFSAMPRWLDIVRKTLGQHDIAVPLCRGHHREVHRFGDGSRSACGRATSGGETLVQRSSEACSQRPRPQPPQKFTVSSAILSQKSYCRESIVTA